jgi:hypothetical protein
MVTSDVSQERERQVLLLSESTNTSSRVIVGFTDGVDTQARQLGALEIAAERFDRVEIGRVGGDSLDDQTGTLGVEERVHPPAAVTGQAVPDQGDLVAVELATQLADEVDQTRVVVSTEPSADLHLGL